MARKKQLTDVQNLIWKIRFLREANEFKALLRSLEKKLYVLFYFCPRPLYPLIS